MEAFLGGKTGCTPKVLPLLLDRGAGTPMPWPLSIRAREDWRRRPERATGARPYKEAPKIRGILNKKQIK